MAQVHEILFLLRTHWFYKSLLNELLFHTAQGAEMWFISKINTLLFHDSSKVYPIHIGQRTQRQTTQPSHWQLELQSKVQLPLRFSSIATIEWYFKDKLIQYDKCVLPLPLQPESSPSLVHTTIKALCVSTEASRKSGGRRTISYYMYEDNT